MAPKLKNAKSYATREDGWRTEWADQLLQWEKGKGDGPTIEVYIGAILGTEKRSEADLTSKNNATNRRWEAFAKAEQTYVKKLRRFASSLRVTDNKHLSAPTGDARGVKLHLWINAERTIGEADDRKHGPHGAESSGSKKRKEADNTDDEDEAPQKKKKAASVKKPKPVAKQGSKTEPVTVVDPETESTEKHAEEPNVEPDPQLKPVDLGSHEAIEKPEGPEPEPSDKPVDEAPKNPEEPELKPTGKDDHEPSKSQEKPETDPVAQQEPSQRPEDDGPPPDENPWPDTPFSDWPTYDDVDSEMAKAFVEAIKHKKSLLWVTLTEMNFPFTSILPFWIAKGIPRDADRETTLPLAREAIMKNRGLARRMAMGEFGKCCPRIQNKTHLENWIGRAMCWVSLSMSSSSAKWAMNKCVKHKIFNNEFCGDLHPNYVFEAIPYSDCPHKRNKKEDPDSEANQKIREARIDWRHQKLKEALESDSSLKIRWRGGDMGHMVAPKELQEYEKVLNDKLSEARAFATKHNLT